MCFFHLFLHFTQICCYMCHSDGCLGSTTSHPSCVLASSQPIPLALEQFVDLLHRFDRLILSQKTQLVVDERFGVLERLVHLLGNI